jgi:NADH-quinone oxidoreductase subunit M
MPRAGGVTLFFALASLGLPGLANFVGEFLVLAGAYPVARPTVIVASLGFVVSAVYGLWLIQALFYGPQTPTASAPDLGRREMAIFAVLILAVVALGLAPQPLIRLVDPVLSPLQRARPQETLAGQEATQGTAPSAGARSLPVPSPGGK